jgi:23S rRNA (uracil1939-C5)-methyltransferase
MNVGDRIALRIESLAFGGDAVGRAPDGRVVFVPGGAPGDEIDCEINELKRGFARALPLAVRASGPLRVAPRCPLAGTCGGCQWQEVEAAAQRAAKSAIALRALGRAGFAVRELVTPSEPFGYRTRARFTAGDETIGLQSRRSHEVIDVDHCPLLDPALDAALAEARRALLPGVQRQIARGGTIAGLVGRGGQVHLALRGLTPAGRDAAQALVGRAAIAGVLADGESFGAREIDTAGEGEPPFWASADGFAQASAAGNRALRRLAAAAARAGGQRALELYAGDGNFTRDLAATARAVDAVESDRAAAQRLARNAPAARATCERAERAARRLADAGERYDLALIDPPRAGAREIVPALARLADRLVYVSCDPMTLARDAQELAKAGLRPIEATPIDLMPQTYHIEIIAIFER